MSTTNVGHGLVLIPAGEALELLQARLPDFLPWQRLLFAAFISPADVGA